MIGRRSLSLFTRRWNTSHLPVSVAAFSKTGQPLVSLYSTKIEGKSHYPPVHIPENLPLHHHILESCRKYANKVAFIDGISGNKTTYAELEKHVKKVASSLVKHGLKQGDVVTVFSYNTPEYFFLYLGAMAAGITVNTMNSAYTAGELAGAIQQCESKMIFTAPELIAPAIEAFTLSPHVQGVVTLNGTAEGAKPFSDFLNDNGSAYSDNLEIDVKEDIIALPYSSGTTGLPKGVMLTHYSLLSNVIQLNTTDTLDYQTDDVFLAVLPFFHIYGQVVIGLSGLAAGCTTVTLPGFDPERFLKAIQHYKVTRLHLVPPMVLFMANHPIVKKFDFSQVVECCLGSAPVGRETIEEAVVAMRNPKVSFRQGYGLTEASPVTHLNPTTGGRYETIGFLVPNTEHKILDPVTGDELGVGQDGELCVKGPQLMKGYFKNEEATKTTIIDGWLHTGDIARVEEDGHVLITDRLKELIKYKAFQVAPAELEALLVAHPSIKDAAVIGKPDEKAGELPRGYIVVKEGEKVSEADIHDYLKDKVAPFKQLSGGIEFRKEIPKSAAGKILRRHLKDELLNQNE